MRKGLVCSLVVVIYAACGPAPRPPGPGSGDDDSTGDSGPTCDKLCSLDGRAVTDCSGNVMETCSPADACDQASHTCVNACIAAESSHSSVGCDYYATAMDSLGNGIPGNTLCFAAFVANTWTTPAHISVDYKGMAMSVATFTRVPTGFGPSLTYSLYDPVAGLPPGQVAIVFLGGVLGPAPQCPATPAVPNPMINGTGIADSFHIKTDVPTVAYQINPYGGGSAMVTGASLLIPTSAWDVNYVAVNVSPQEVAGSTQLNPSLNIIARDDNTTVTLLPNNPVAGGNGIPGGAVGAPLAIHLSKGQHAQITQGPELTGSVITADRPVGVMAGQYCMRVPAGTTYCDHGEQMVPPVRALGSKNLGVMYRPRPNESQTFWRIVGAVDGTVLTWSTPVGGPTTLAKGQAVTFQTGAPFYVESQDKDHPFMLFTYMTSNGFAMDGFGDPDFVLDVPPDQFLHHYVFFTDPTYPETNLVLVRGRGTDAQFHDVVLDCGGSVQGWQPISADFEFARTDLQTGNFGQVGTCSNGRHEIHSDAPFGLQVWGWGTPTTTTFTRDVSYGYPGGMNVRPINDVVIQ
jgi:IgGFc binding protein